MKTTKRQSACGFSVAKYGPQKEVNPYRADCGNGVRADGTNIVADPADTSVPIGPDDRTFLVHVPEDLDPNVAAPLVFVFHGYTMSAALMPACAIASRAAPTAISH